MIPSGGRRTELVDIRGKKVVEDWVSTGMGRAKVAMATSIRGCDGNRTKVIVVVGLVRDQGSVTGVLIGDVTSVTTGLVRSRKDGCSHGWRASWQAVNTRRREKGRGRSESIISRLGCERQCLHHPSIDVIIRITFFSSWRAGKPNGGRGQN